MKRSSSTIIRITVFFALLLSLILALAIPLAYFVIGYEHQTTVIETEAEFTAFTMSQLISANPEYWRYEEPRLVEILSRSSSRLMPETRSVIDGSGSVLATHGEAVDRPVLVRSRPLYDAGRIVARIEISRSLRPLLKTSLILGVIGAALGAGFYLFLRLAPLHALTDALGRVVESEERFRAIASTAADGLIVMDDRGRVTFWNSTAEKMFGFSAEEAVGRELHLLIAPEEFHERYRAGFERFARTGEGPAVGNTLEFTARRKDGSRFPIEVSLSAMNLSGKWHAVGILRDISIRKKTEDELLKLEKSESLGLLAGGIAHDFNNVLTVILGSVNLAQLDIKPGDPAFEQLAQAERSIVRARELSTRLLTFAKGGAPVKRPSSITEIVKEACALSLSGSAVKSSFSFADDLHAVEVDAGQINQVFHNVALNAVQAMPGCGEIAVRGRNIAVGPGDGLPLAAGRYVLIEVADQGAGIPKENLLRIFDPFFTTKPKGSGLGLATSYSIMKKHGGLIRAESSPGAGSVFFIYLPAAGSPVRPAETRPGAVPPGVVIPKGQGRVLVMDDEEDVRRVAGQFLKIGGYEPFFAKDGAEAVSLYRSAMEAGQPFHAVILDLTVTGGMGGKDAVKKLLELDPRANVIVMSGYSNDLVLSDHRSYGFSGMVVKPFTLETLCKAILGTGAAPKSGPDSANSTK